MLTFDAERHEYTVDGVIVPSVTTIVAPLGVDYDDDDSLTAFAIDYAAERGTVMHAYIAHRLEGGAPEEFEMPDEFADYADGVEQFLAEHEITPYAVETPLTDGVAAGTPDLVCEFDGELAILDYKFVSNVAKSRVCGQLGGYLKLCESNEVFPERLYAVQFKRGDYRLYPVDSFMARTMWSASKLIYDMRTYKHPRGRIGG